MAHIQIHGEGMRKPVYLAVLGISIVVAAVSLGVILTRYLGLRAYSPKGTAQAAATPAGRVLPDIPLEQWNNLFAPGDGMKLASRLPAVNGKTASRATRTSFVLVGTIVSSTPSARRAILWASGMKEPKGFREKDEVEPGAILASVERDKVWITRGNEREKLEILPVGSRGRPTAAESPTGAPAVASPNPQPALSPGMPSRPGAVASPGTSPDNTRTPVVAPKTPSGDEDEEALTPRERRRRSRGVPR
jgi:hypothetical protein